MCATDLIDGASPLLTRLGCVVAVALLFSIVEYLTAKVFYKDNFVVVRAGAIVQFLARKQIRQANNAEYNNN